LFSYDHRLNSQIKTPSFVKRARAPALLQGRRHSHGTLSAQRAHAGTRAQFEVKASELRSAFLAEVAQINDAEAA